MREGGKVLRIGEENVLEDSVRKFSKKGGKFIILLEVWKEDGDVGLLLVFLVDLFGEGMFFFIFLKELLLFI